MTVDEVEAINAKQPLHDYLPKWSLALNEVTKVSVKGDEKHGSPWDSQSKDEAYFLNKALRHYFEHATGTERDEETNMLHLAQATWHFLCALQTKLAKEQKGI